MYRLGPKPMASAWAIWAAPGGAFVRAYGFAHGGKSLVWQVSETMFAFFLTEACGLPPATMGWVLAASLVINAFADLLVGLLLSRRVRSVGDAGRAQASGALAAGAAFALFGFSGLVPESARLAFVLVTLLLFRLAYPLFDNPQNAMLALAAGDDDGRVRLAVVRYLAAGFTSVLVALAVMPLVRAREAGVQSLNFAMVALCLACLAIGSAHVLKRRSGSRDGLPIAGSGDRREGASQASGPIPGLAVYVMIFVFALCNSVFGKLLPYFTAFASHSVALGGTLMICSALGRFLSQFMWREFARRYSLALTLRAALLCWAAGAAIFLLGSAGSLVVLGLSGLLYGIGCGGVLMSLWALAASAVRAEGIASTTMFGGLTFCSKTGLATSIALIAVLLSGTDYREAAGFASDVTPFMAIMPIAGACLCLALSLTGRFRWRLPPMRPLIQPAGPVRRTGA